MYCKKKIKIFIGSSITEFEGERKDLELFMRRISDDFEDTYDIKLQPLLCEDEDTAMTKERKQDVFNNLVRGSDMCFFIFYTKAGKFTVEELETAYEKFKGSENKRPKVYVYFKKLMSDIAEDISIIELKDKLDGEYKQYYGSFEHVDTLKLRILENLTEQEMKDFNIKQETETVYGGEGEKPVFNLKVNGKKVLTLNDISEFANSEELKVLQAELVEVEKRYYEMLPRYAKDNADGDFYKEYADVAAKRQHLKDTIDELSKRLFDLSLNLSRDEVCGEMTERQKRAYELLSQGDRAGCLAVLNEKDIDDDYKRRIAEKKRQMSAIEEEAKRETIDYIRIHKFAIKVLQTAFSYDGRFEEIERRYESIVDATEEFNVEIDVLYDYACYLHNQKNFSRAIEIAQRLQKLYDKNPTAVSDNDQAEIYNNLGVFYDELKDHQNAELHYKRALEIREQLATENPAAYEPDLAMTCNNLGILYYNINDYQNAELQYKRALEIRERLAVENPAAYEPDLAEIYNNLGVFYDNINDHQNAELYFKRALEIYERLAVKNLMAYVPDLAMTFNNLGVFYKNINDYQNAEHNLKRALEIRKRLASENPSAHEPDLAKICNNLGGVYYNINDYQNAELYFKKAFEIYERIASENTAAYVPDLAITFNNLGSLYQNINDYQNAELYLKRALEIYERLAAETPEAYEPDLAMTCNNLGVFYDNINDYKNAELYYKRAFEIYERLAAETPEAYEPVLAMTCNNLGVFYDNINDHKNAELYFNRALEIKERLAAETTEAYESDLAMTCNNLGSLYYNINDYQNAEHYLKRALEIYERLAAEYPEAYVSDLAMTFNNLGEFYKNINDYQNAELYYKRALEIYERLAAETPEAHESDLAECLFNYALPLKENGEEMAMEYILRAKEIAEKYAKKVPSCATLLEIINENLSSDDN